MDQKFDVRTLPHTLRRGKVTKEELQAFLDALPDDADLAEETETRFNSAFADRQKRLAEAAADKA